MKNYVELILFLYEKLVYSYQTYPILPWSRWLWSYHTWPKQRAILPTAIVKDYHPYGSLPREKVDPKIEKEKW